LKPVDKVKILSLFILEKSRLTTLTKRRFGLRSDTAIKVSYSDIQSPKLKLLENPFTFRKRKFSNLFIDG